MTAAGEHVRPPTPAHLAPGVAEEGRADVGNVPGRGTAAEDAGRPGYGGLQ